MIKKIGFLLGVSILVNVLFWGSIWAHHLFVTGLNPLLDVVGAFIVLALVVPPLLYVRRKLVRYYKDNFPATPATLFVLGFFILLVGYLMSQPVIGRSIVDIQLHDTYFVIAGAHVLLIMALFFLIFAGIYSLVKMNVVITYIHFGISLIGCYLFVWPMPYKGLADMPRPYIDYSGWVGLNGYGESNLFIFRVALVFLSAQLLFIFNLLYSIIATARRSRHS